LVLIVFEAGHRSASTADGADRHCRSFISIA
jgi:hypothetical protein